MPIAIPTKCPKCSSLEIEFPVEVPALFNNGEFDQFVDPEANMQYIRHQAITCRCPNCNHEWSIEL